MSTHQSQANNVNNPSEPEPSPDSLGTSNTINQQPHPLSNFHERNLSDADDASEDENGFMRTPNGSFWDSQGEYFNREGFDKHNGFYNKYGEYVPGPGWDEKKLMYTDDEQFIFVGEENVKKTDEEKIIKLKEQEDKDRKVINEVNDLKENPLPEDDDYVENVEEKEDLEEENEEIKRLIKEATQNQKKEEELNKEEEMEKTDKGITNNLTSSKPNKEANEKICINTGTIEENKEDKEMKGT